MALNPDPTAVMGRRVGAAVIDGVVVFVPAMIAFSSKLESFEYSSTSEAEAKCEQYQDEQESGICVNSGSTIYFTHDISPVGLYLIGFSFVMFVLLQGLTGWSLGKVMTGLRCVQADGKVIGIPRAALRWVLWIVDSLPFLWLVGLITSFTTVGHRRVGDMVAKSYVVRADAAGHPVEVGGLTVAPGAPHIPGPYSGPSWTTSATATAAPTAKPGPQWDEARGTYIQWDPEAQDWMRWDDAAKRWDPISAAEPVIPSPPPPPPPATPSQPGPPPPPADPNPPPAPPLA